MRNASRQEIGLWRITALVKVMCGEQATANQKNRPGSGLATGILPYRLAPLKALRVFYSAFLPAFFALAHLALAASEILFRAAAVNRCFGLAAFRLPVDERGLPFCRRVPSSAAIAAWMASRWFWSSRRMRVVSIRMGL